VKHYSLRTINSLIIFGIRKNCLSSGRSLLLHKFTRRALNLTVVIIAVFHYYQLHIIFCSIPFSQNWWTKLLEIIAVDFDITDQLLISFLTIIKCWEKMGVQWESTWDICRLKTAYDSVKSAVF
jgi:hypothetical protein